MFFAVCIFFIVSGISSILGAVFQPRRTFASRVLVVAGVVLVVVGAVLLIFLLSGMIDFPLARRMAT